ncbi:mannonate dehydratase [Cellulophaga sp. F20128]|uniref:mannonate dehydratase n=1 Tax=Cellulophaga sp. F20128 TaxID=2926413 RepID=UPI001FF3CFBD|nr:mannonate dehydratase [Cellulophaga sp. F20128]MCK0156325.1 mannonate dehydratase [Cellulophaga sp. F20128]
MKLGFGLYRHMLTVDNYRFAKQCGATHLVIHLVDYFGHAQKDEDSNQPVGKSEGWGKAGIGTPIWSVEELIAIKKEINAQGLVLEAIENFDPSHWHDILLDGPKKKAQMEDIKQLIRNVGAAGIPNFGYNFSIAGVASRSQGAYARGGAMSVGMEGVDETPIPNGMAWNMVYDENAPEGTIAKISHAELWSRLQYFLDEIIPVAEEAGVSMAAHPDDPPMPYVRDTPRLVYQPDLYQKLIDMKPSKANKLEFCLGSLSEMTEGDVYEATDQYSKQDKISYIHFRNVVGKVPTYKEVFVDEGDIDMIRILRILKKNNYQGVLIPDHTPQMTCDAPWYAGMAYAMGYMKAAMKLV